MSGGFRSLLFVPGTRADRFGKALGAGADAVCIDLEDAVPQQEKGAARETVLAFLAGRHSADSGAAALGVRVNGVRTTDGVRDLAAMADAPARPDFLMLPKISCAAEVAIVADIFPGLPLWPIVESALGLSHAEDIAAAPGVAGLLFGGVDYAAELGCALSWDALLYARGKLAAARAAARVELLDVPFLDIKNDQGLAESTLAVKQLGFTGRGCIHPSQVATVNRGFTPTPEEAEAARRLVAAFAAAQGGAALLDGRLVELPVFLAARRLLDRLPS